jgi:uncharacterized protein YndB with AHSA1/START domain
MPDGVSAAVQQFTIRRVFEAPRQLVFKAWIEPAQIARWWGPDTFVTPLETIAVEPKPGGVFRSIMVSKEDRSEHPVVGVILEIVEPERLVLSFPAEDNPTIPIDGETIVTVTFTDLDGQTELTLSQTGLQPSIARDSAIGWGEQFEHLAELFRSA